MQLELSQSSSAEQGAELLSLNLKWKGEMVESAREWKEAALLATAALAAQEKAAAEATAAAEGKAAAQAAAVAEAKAVAEVKAAAQEKAAAQARRKSRRLGEELAAEKSAAAASTREHNAELRKAVEAVASAKGKAAASAASAASVLLKARRVFCGVRSLAACLEAWRDARRRVLAPAWRASSNAVRRGGEVALCASPHA